MACQSCGTPACSCSACPSTTLNQPRIIAPTVTGGLFQNGQFQSPTILGGSSTGQAINSATIDCLSTVCTQPPGTDNATIASTAFVQQAILDGYGTPAFCGAVVTCVLETTDTNALCPIVVDCFNDSPGIINNTNAFGPGAQATKLAAGVTRYATQAEVLAGICGVALEPCELIAALNSPYAGNAFWNAFGGAVNTYYTSNPVASCASITPCVNGLITAYVNSGNPAFCAQVNACVPSITDIWVNTTGDSMTGDLNMGAGSTGADIVFSPPPIGLGQDNFIVFNPYPDPFAWFGAGGISFPQMNDFGYQTGSIAWYGGPQPTYITGPHTPTCPGVADRIMLITTVHGSGPEIGVDKMTFYCGGSPTPLTPCSGAPARHESGFLFTHYDGTGGYFPLAEFTRVKATIRSDGELFIRAPQGIVIDGVGAGLPGQRLTSQGPGLPPIWAP